MYIGGGRSVVDNVPDYTADEPGSRPVIGYGGSLRLVLTRRFKLNWLKHSLTSHVR